MLKRLEKPAVLKRAEGLDDARVEVLAGQALDLCDRVFDRPCLLVGAIVRQGDKDVGDGDDPAGQGDRFAGKTV